jgi:SAM-dependent methyltransferase
MCAAFLARHLPRDAAPVLDAACGTGMVGDCLRVLGYREVVGIDMSEPMLARAKARGVYASLRRMTLGGPLDFPDGHFAGVVASGVFTEGHCSHAAFDELIRVTRPGGRLVFSVRVETYERRGFRERQAALEAEGRWRLCESSEPFRSFTVQEPDVFGRVFVYEAA